MKEFPESSTWKGREGTPGLPVGSSEEQRDGSQAGVTCGQRKPMTEPTPGPKHTSPPGELPGTLSASPSFLFSKPFLRFPE